MNNHSESLNLRQSDQDKEEKFIAYPIYSTGYVIKADDKEVWANFVLGSEEAFCEIYENHFEALVRLGQQFSLSKELVRDDIQDFFIELRERRTNLSKINYIRPYLIKSFRRRLLDLKRKLDKRERHMQDFYGMGFRFTPSSEKLILEKETETEKSIKLTNAMQRLSVNQREAIYYFYFENMSYQDIQQIMGMKYVRSVRNLVYKALDQLRKVYMQ